MLFQIVKDLIKRPSRNEPGKSSLEILETAQRYFRTGEIRLAIPSFRRYLEANPFDVGALNDLGCCLAIVGDDAEASALFEKAFSLDDSYIPAAINHAKNLADRQLSAQAMPYLAHAKLYSPNFCATDSVLASILLSRGLTSRARAHARRAWLASFDDLRLANCYLLYTAYDDIDELELAAEHR